MSRRQAILTVLAFLGSATAAEASPITYEFTVTATDGPLAGETSTGRFSFDSSSVTPGATHAKVGLLTELFFTWDGITYTEDTANTGWLAFYPSGELRRFVFGNICSDRVCRITGPNEWTAYWERLSNFFYSTMSDNTAVFGRVTARRLVPEPLTLLLFAAGLVGAAATGRRRVQRRASNPSGPPCAVDR